MRGLWQSLTSRGSNVAAAGQPAPEQPATPAAEIALVPAPRLTLYALEKELEALTDTAEMVEQDQEPEFLRQFAEILAKAVEKRDRVGEFMAHLEAQSRFADAEIERLQERKAFFTQALERMAKYVMFTIQSFPMDAKGRWAKLEGRTTTFQLKKCPPSVEITDEEAVPAEYKATTITIPLPLWQELLDSLPVEPSGKLEGSVRNAKIAVSKTAVKAALQDKQPVPGARLVDDKYRVERR